MKIWEWKKNFAWVYPLVGGIEHWLSSQVPEADDGT